MAEKPKPRESPRIKARDRIFIKKIAEGASQTEAAIAAGTKSKRPDDAGHRIMKRIQSSGAGTDLLDRYGLTDGVLVEKYLKPLLNAKDLLIRIRALDMAFRLKGLFKSEQQALPTGVKVFLIDRGARPPRPALDIPTLKNVLEGDGDSQPAQSK